MSKEPPPFVVEKGWLTKQGYWITNWKKRYFVLTSDRKLSYYLTPAQPVAHGVIHLKDMNKGPSPNSDPLIFELSSDKRTYFFTAENQQQRDLWINAILLVMCGDIQSEKDLDLIHPQQSKQNMRSNLSSENVNQPHSKSGSKPIATKASIKKSIDSDWVELSSSSPESNSPNNNAFYSPTNSPDLNSFEIHSSNNSNSSNSNSNNNNNSNSNKYSSHTATSHSSFSRDSTTTATEAINHNHNHSDGNSGSDSDSNNSDGHLGLGHMTLHEQNLKSKVFYRFLRHISIHNQMEASLKPLSLNFVHPRSRGSEFFTEVKKLVSDGLSVFKIIALLTFETCDSKSQYLNMTEDQWLPLYIQQQFCSHLSSDNHSQVLKTPDASNNFEPLSNFEKLQNFALLFSMLKNNLYSFPTPHFEPIDIVSGKPIPVLKLLSTLFTLFVVLPTQYVSCSGYMAIKTFCEHSWRGAIAKGIESRSNGEEKESENEVDMSGLLEALKNGMAIIGFVYNWDEGKKVDFETMREDWESGRKVEWQKKGDVQKVMEYANMKWNVPLVLDGEDFGEENEEGVDGECLQFYLSLFIKFVLKN